MTKFEIGKTYTHNFAGDYQACVAWKVIKRTEKSVTIESNVFGRKTRRVKIWNNAETVMPLGSYSMAPVLFAG